LSATLWRSTTRGSPTSCGALTQAKPIIDTIDFSETPESNDEDSSEEKIEALAEIICRAGNESTAALFVLMGVLENSRHPQLLANAAKHSAFARCAELNLYGIVDAQIPVVAGELLAGDAIS
jgi:hypothetical protein